MNAADTNVFIYLFDVDEPAKQVQARACIDALIRSPGETALLWQVACEFLGCVRRWEQIGKVTASDADRHFQDVLAMFPLVLPTARVFDVSKRLTMAYSRHTAFRIGTACWLPRRSKRALTRSIPKICKPAPRTRR